jgi:hypothetical protein
MQFPSGPAPWSSDCDLTFAARSRHVLGSFILNGRLRLTSVSRAVYDVFRWSRLIPCRFADRHPGNEGG